MTLQAQDHLETLYELNEQGRIVSTREPDPTLGPAFVLIRRAESCAWAIGASVDDLSAEILLKLARDEKATTDFHQPPIYAERYQALVTGELEVEPAFEFPHTLELSNQVIIIDDHNLIRQSFAGWTKNELPERAPIVGIIKDGKPVSICFSARISQTAAEAGVETVPKCRGLGFAGLVTTAWAAQIRASGRVPVYSTSWSNKPSLAVAQKIGLATCASYWSIYQT